MEETRSDGRKGQWSIVILCFNKDNSSSSVMTEEMKDHFRSMSCLQGPPSQCSSVCEKSFLISFLEIKYLLTILIYFA